MLSELIDPYLIAIAAQSLHVSQTPSSEGHNLQENIEKHDTVSDLHADLLDRTESIELFQPFYNCAQRGPNVV